MPELMHRWFVRLAVLALLMLAGACSESEPPPTVTEPRTTAETPTAACTLTRRYQLAENDEPARDLTVTPAEGGSAVTPDWRGRWSLDAGTRRTVVVRVQSDADLLDITNRQGRRGTAAIPAGLVEVTYQLDAACHATVAGVVNVSPGSARGRPHPPPLPDDFHPSAATRAARPPQPGPGAGDRVPWTGSFWLTAPVVTAGICDITDPATRDAAEIALKRWQEASGLGWQIRRDDHVCDESVPGPKMLIVRETVDDDTSLGEEYEDALDTPGCDPDAAVSNCWIDIAYVTANPPGFDTLTRDEQIATMLHEIGHGLGLAHATICGETIMWADDACARSNRPLPGADDISSLNTLLTVTLAVLQQSR